MLQIKFFEIPSSARAQRSSPGCDLPKATTLRHSPLCPALEGGGWAQRCLETDQCRVSICCPSPPSPPAVGEGQTEPSNPPPPPPQSLGSAGEGPQGGESPQGPRGGGKLHTKCLGLEAGKLSPRASSWRFPAPSPCCSHSLPPAHKICAGGALLNKYPRGRASGFICRSIQPARRLRKLLNLGQAVRRHGLPEASSIYAHSVGTQPPCRPHCVDVSESQELRS